MAKKITKAFLSTSIYQLREQWLKRGEVSKISEINRAWCYSFAEELLDLLGHKGVHRDLILYDRGTWGDKGVYWLSNEDFQYFLNKNDEYGVWNEKLLEKWGIIPPFGLKWEEMNKIPFGYHVFIVFNYRFYDAECPEGTENFFHLPLYRKTIEEYLKEKTQWNK